MITNVRVLTSLRLRLLLDLCFIIHALRGISSISKHIWVDVRTILIILMARRGEHPVGTKTVTGEEDEVSAAAALVQTNLLMPKVQSPHPDSAHAHTDHPSEPVYVQISSRARTLARWAAVEMECGSADCRVPITWTLRRL